MQRLAMATLLLPLVLGLAAPPITPLLAQESPAARTDHVAETSARSGPTDPAEVEAFLDGVMAAHLEEKKIVGAVVSIVRGDEVLVAKGYGYADREKQQPVDPDRTLFRIGSISKLFTWIAVMQQVEEGTLDLDTDINEYLDFHVPYTFDEPITLFHLLTHTAGFEDRLTGLFSSSETPRGEWMAANVPARVREPGRFSAYSNYGAALAGHIVERVTETAWEEYIERRILEPLGMEHTTGRQPLPEALAPHMSVGYANVGERIEPRDFEALIPYAPAGSISASAADMARFMIASLRYGEYAGERILGEETVRRMYSRVFGHDERVNGYGLGYYEKSANGLRIIGHGGDTQWFHSDLALVPEEDLGIFVSYNTEAGASISFGPFLELVLDHYYPEDEPPALVAAEPTELERYAGVYQPNRRSYTKYEKVLALLMPSLRIDVDAEKGELILTGLEDETRFAPLGDGLFRDVEGSGRLTFRVDETGRATHVFLDSWPMMALERLAWYESPTLHQILLGVSVLLFLSALVFPLIRYLLERRFVELPPLYGRERGARWLAILVALLHLGGLVALGTVFGEEDLFSGELGGLGLVLALPVLGSALTLGLVWLTITAWRTRMWGRWARVHYTVFTLGALVFTWVLNHWNLLGWNY